MARRFAVVLALGDRGLGIKVRGGIDENEHGLVITSVEPGGVADDAGLLEGDVVIEVSGNDISNVTHDEAVRVISEAQSPLVFVVTRAMEREPPASAVAAAPAPVPSEGGIEAAPAPVVSAATPHAEEMRRRRHDSVSKSTVQPVALGDLPATGTLDYGAKLSWLVELISERGVNGLARLNQTWGGVEGVAKRLNSDVTEGIAGSAEDIAARQHAFGRNQIPGVVPKSLLQLMWEALQDATLIVLIIAGAISLLLGLTVEEDTETAWIEGAAIMVSVVIVVMVTAINDLQKERQFQELQAQQETQQLCKVIRGGKQVTLQVSELVVGDVLLVQNGSILPADAVLISGAEVRCDESALTGESLEIEKTLDKDPFLLSGTAVKNGTGRAVVTCVGLFSEEGIINKLITGVGAEETARLEALDKGVAASEADVEAEARERFENLSEEEREKFLKLQEKKGQKKQSVLQTKLTRMAILIGYAGSAAAIFTFLILVIRFAIEDFAVNGEVWDHGEHWSEILDFVIVGITVLVVAVPEGLPLAVTLSLAFSVKKMMKDNNLVRVLASCETMGNATTICSDKTGTLTQNRMTVTKAWVAGNTFDDPKEVGTSVTPELVERIMHVAVYASDAKTGYSVDPETKVLNQDGNKTECALLKFSDELGRQSYGDLRTALPEEGYCKIYPFNSTKKRMSTVIPLPGGGYRLLVKGASEIILGLCARYTDHEGRVVELTAERKEEIKQNVIFGYAKQALRVICLATRDFPEAVDWDDEDMLLQDLDLTCFVGIMDPLRDEVKDAIARCHSAGVVVRMVTGDNMITARAIAINAGIISENDDFIVMEGPEFRKKVLNEDGSINHEVLQSFAPNLRVIGRCSPTDKYNLVKGLIYSGEVVAVTGDGTNDGPALSEADVGFAMGIAGTAVAKQASDIIITDDNFSSIVKAISWGRNVYDSISKFLVFQLTVNVVAVTVAFVGAASIKETPLRATQMLWVNLIMDTFAALALATEPPVPELLDRKPYARDAPLVSRGMIRQILGHSIYQLIVIFTLVYSGEEIFNIDNGRMLDHDAPPTRHYTIVFNTFVQMQIFNEINARKIHNQINVFRGLFNNTIYVVIIIGTFLAQIVIIEFGGTAMRTTGLSIEQWIACVVLGLGSLLWNVVLHFIFPVSLIPESWGRSIKATPQEEEIVDYIGSPQEQRRSRPTGVLWVRSLNRLRAQVRVVSAFRSSAAVSRLRQRTARMSHYTLGGPRPAPDGDRMIPHPRRPEMLMVCPEHAQQHPSPAQAMWRSAMHRVRFQLRVVRSFQSGIVRRPGVAGASDGLAQAPAESTV
eukprot:m.39842 g.39842  ORF g.39842 m.39842 type:complete len:1317 (-) comp11313_c0_seq1:125-4075(-)